MRTIISEIPMFSGIPLVVEKGHDETQQNQKEEQKNDQIICQSVHLKNKNHTHIKMQSLNLCFFFVFEGKITSCGDSPWIF